MRFILICFIQILTTFAFANDSLFSNAPPWFHVEPPGQEIFASRKMFQWTPTGAEARASRAECSATHLESLMRRPALSPGDSIQILKNFFNICQDHLARFAPPSIVSMLRFSGVRYAVETRHSIQAVRLTLPSGEVIRGLLGMKDTQTPRPFVIGICGAQCTLRDTLPRYMMTHLFDESPFNVLILDNVTGPDSIHDNKRFALGGFEEGRRVFEVLQVLSRSDSPILPVVSSWHVIGYSLGGQAALYASLYGSANALPKSTPRLQSVIAMCPVVDLKPTLDTLLNRHDIYGRAFRDIIWTTLSSALAYANPLPPGEAIERPRTGAESLSLIERIMTARYLPLSERADFFLPPFLDSVFKTSNDYWNLNSFSDRLVDDAIPTLLIASSDDPVVAPDVNAFYVDRLLSDHPSRDHIGVIQLEKGGHCASALSYGWSITSATLREFILSQSPEYRDWLKEFDIPLRQFEGALRTPDERYFGGKWIFSEGKNQFQYIVKIFDPDARISDTSTCRTWNPYFAFEGCFRSVTISVPSVLLNLEPRFHLEVAAEQEAALRWLNTRAHVLTKGHADVIDTREPPAFIRVPFE